MLIDALETSLHVAFEMCSYGPYTAGEITELIKDCFAQSGPGCVPNVFHSFNAMRDVESVSALSGYCHLWAVLFRLRTHVCLCVHACSWMDGVG